MVDNHQPFFELLKKNAKKEEISHKNKAVKGDMFNLNYENNSFDLIWSEGAIFVIGFEKGLREWKRLLTDKGYLVVSELAWLRHYVSEEAKTYMKQGYPVIKTTEENL